MTETQERLIVLSYKSFNKIKVPKVFNWDSTGYPEKNIINIIRDEKRFKDFVKNTPPIIRVALHPRDPNQALKDQKEMMCKLMDIGYEIQRYREILPKLQHLSLSLPLPDN